MKSYKSAISLAKNSRGCYIIDTIKGCSGCNTLRPLGCYDNCYAQNIASRYGFNFQGVVKRDFIKDSMQTYFMGFKDTKHEGEIIQAIKNADMPFIRIGEMGDPSEDWAHTIDICESIQVAGKPIVIITKHWKPFPEYLLNRISKMNICINTSTSSLDNAGEIRDRLYQYQRLKDYCNSVLRVVTCMFNTETHEGHMRNIVQDYLLKNYKVIETVFRPNKNNKLVKNKIIHVQEVQFLKVKMLASLRDENAYLGRCDTCPDMCGLTL